MRVDSLVLFFFFFFPFLFLLFDESIGSKDMERQTGKEILILMRP